MVQKAVEMGAARLQPVLTAHAQASRINLERMQANAIEAAEQCGILTLPEIAAPVDFDRMLASRDGGRLLVFCDEDAETKDPVAALAAHRAAAGPTPVDVLVGPEGGFADRERAALLAVAEHGAARARTAHPARRHRGGRRPRAGRRGARRLAAGLIGRLPPYDLR